jgi:nicotinamidase/pyrazinamidase
MKSAQFFYTLLCSVMSVIPLCGTLTPTNTAVIVVDVQEDFTQPNSYKLEKKDGKPIEGRLQVPNSGDDYVTSVIKATRLLKEKGFKIYATQDWHPQNHISFAANHRGKNPFDQIPLKGAPGGMQTLWPIHCVQNTSGARILLPLTLFSGVIKKGTNPKHDSYSGFADDGGQETELNEILKKNGIKNLIVYGIATDYCVMATALDGVLHGVDRGYTVYLVTDLSRGVDFPAGSVKEAIAKMEENGVKVVNSLDELFKK